MPSRKAEHQRRMFPSEHVVYHLSRLLRQNDECHPNGRLAGRAISDGTHLTRSRYPRAIRRYKIIRKTGRVKSGGTLLNQRFLPSLLKHDEDIAKLVSLIRSYFALGGHHIQFNIVDTATLHAAQKHRKNTGTYWYA